MTEHVEQEVQHQFHLSSFTYRYAMAVVWMHFVRVTLTRSSKKSLLSFSRKNSLNSVIKISKEKS